MEALRVWRRQLAAWEIPPPIRDRMAESPWVLPREVFVRRADRHVAAPGGATFTAAAEAVGAGGTVLDVGCGAGAASLPLAGRVPVTGMTFVDCDPALLEAAVERAGRTGVPVRAVPGYWPEAAGRAGRADVVIAANVVYNVADLAPFVAALTASARRRVVVELAAVHPLTELNPLWRRFWGISRPDGPVAADFVAALAELGVTPSPVTWRRAPEPEYGAFDDLCEVTRRRLGLAEASGPRVRQALLDLGVDPRCPPDLGSSGRELVTVTWAGAG